MRGVRFLIGWITIVAIFVSSVPWELAPFVTAGDDVPAVAGELGELPGCPDEDAPCDPCDDGCLCPCCPTLVVPPEVLSVPEFQPPVETKQPRFAYTRGLSPADVHFRVFHLPSVPSTQVGLSRIDSDARHLCAASPGTSATYSSPESDGEMDQEQPSATHRPASSIASGATASHLHAFRSSRGERALRIAAGLVLAGGLLFNPGCASTHATSTLPEPGVYAPAEIAQPFIPSGEPVDPSTTSTLTLEQLLVYADSHAPAIQTARARVGLAEAGVIGADIVFPANPQLSFGAGGRTIENTTGFEFEVSVQQQLEIAGEPGLRLEAAEDQQRLSEAAVNEVRWSVHVEVHRLFVDILLVRERLAQAERFVAFAQSMRDIASRQVEAGESSPLILLVADADLAQTREAVIEAQQAGESLEARLAAVIGWAGDTLPDVQGTLPDVRPAPDTDSLLVLMAEHHPSLRTSELAVVAGQSRLALVDREAWPDPTIGFSYGREPAPGPEADADIWLFNLTFPLPLWRTNQGGRAHAEAGLVVADRERDATATRLRAELLQAAIALDAAVERVALYETGVVPQLEENLVLLQRAYELGEVDVHQVSQTRERLLTATGRYIDARITYHETAAALEGLVGTELWPAQEVSP